jgi:5'-methylthioadenosine phosphorylase
MEGPQFSSQAESHSYRTLGASVIGMTNMPEAKLAREAEIDYATLALVTDFDCWHPDHDHVTTDQVVAVVQANVANAQKILSLAVKKFDFTRTLETDGIVKNAMMTSRDRVSKEVVERLEPIVGKYFSE